MKTGAYIGMLLLSCNAVGADSYILGRGISQKTITGVETPCVQDIESICDGVWARWEIRADETLSGPTISGRIRVAVVQHSRFIPSYFKTFRLFVLSPINDAEQRKLLHADFYLIEFSVAHEMYCLDSKPTEFLSDSDLYFRDRKGGRPYCFERPEKDH